MTEQAQAEGGDMNETDIAHLRRCIELATEARAQGNAPFGSLLVSRDGEVIAERRNEVNTTGDQTAHPELALASWASRNLEPAERTSATMYTSGEHCTMCAAGHVWAGIGRLVFAFSSEMIREHADPGRTRVAISAREVIERSNVKIRVDGPCLKLAGKLPALFQRP